MNRIPPVEKIVQSTTRQMSSRSLSNEAIPRRRLVKRIRLISTGIFDLGSSVSLYRPPGMSYFRQHRLRRYFVSSVSPHGGGVELSHVKGTRTTDQNGSLFDYSFDITRTRSHNPQGHSMGPLDQCRRQDATALVDQLLAQTRQLVFDHEARSRSNDNSSDHSFDSKDVVSHHVLAFSGGVDSSLVAALLYKILEEEDRQHYYHHHKLTAVLGISPAVPRDQVVLAETVANQIGISLEQVKTAEGSDDEYIRNDGKACLVCKTYLYSTLQSIASRYMANVQDIVQLYNGTNADDRKDPTRLGLIAADNFDVLSPLASITKDQVRLAARHIGLPNWNYAASPCLRSRIAWGVPATRHHLNLIEECESDVRKMLQLDATVNMRVRLLSQNRICIEMDSEELGRASDVDWEERPYFVALKRHLLEEGTGVDAKPTVMLREFQSGSVAKKTVEAEEEEDDLHNVRAGGGIGYEGA